MIGRNRPATSTAASKNGELNGSDRASHRYCTGVRPKFRWSPVYCMPVIPYLYARERCNIFLVFSEWRLSVQIFSNQMYIFTTKKSFYVCMFTGFVNQAFAASILGMTKGMHGFCVLLHFCTENSRKCVTVTLWPLTFGDRMWHLQCGATLEARTCVFFCYWERECAGSGGGETRQ